MSHQPITADNEMAAWAHRALVVLENMAKEQTPGLFRSRWVISHEPLRNDAAWIAPHLRRAIEAYDHIQRTSEPVDGGNTFNVYGVTFTADPKAPRSAVHQALEYIQHAFTSVATMLETKPEEPDWTVTLAAQAKVAYANGVIDKDQVVPMLLTMVVEGLCHLGREVRRGGAK